MFLFQKLLQRVWFWDIEDEMEDLGCMAFLSGRFFKQQKKQRLNWYFCHPALVFPACPKSHSSKKLTSCSSNWPRPSASKHLEGSGVAWAREEVWYKNDEGCRYCRPLVLASRGQVCSNYFFGSRLKAACGQKPKTHLNNERITSQQEKQKDHQRSPETSFRSACSTAPKSFSQKTKSCDSPPPEEGNLISCKPKHRGLRWLTS